MGQLLSILGTIVGALIAGGVLTVAWQMWAAKKQEIAHKKEVEQAFDFQSYRSIDTKYYDYLKMVVQYPELGVSQYSRPTENLSPTDEARRNTIIEMHFSVFETAYIGRDISRENLERRWPSWDQYIKAHLRRSDVQSLWQKWKSGEVRPGSSGFDSEFEKYINECLDQIALLPPVAAPMV